MYIVVASGGDKQEVKLKGKIQSMRDGDMCQRKNAEKRGVEIERSEVRRSCKYSYLIYTQEALLSN